MHPQNIQFACILLFWHTVSADLEKKKIALKEKRRAISEVMSEIEEKEMQKEDIILKIQKHKEEQMKRKDCKMWLFFIYGNNNNYN